MITGTIPTGGIVQVMSKQTTDDQSQWVQLKLCSIPAGTSVTDAPTETDPTTNPATNNETSGVEGLNTPESTQIDQPLIVPPGSVGWIVESQVAAVSESIQDLQPTQKGSCGP